MLKYFVCNSNISDLKKTTTVTDTKHELAKCNYRAETITFDMRGRETDLF